MKVTFLHAQTVLTAEVVRPQRSMVPMFRSPTLGRAPKTGTLLMSLAGMY